MQDLAGLDVNAGETAETLATTPPQSPVQARGHSFVQGLRPFFTPFFDELYDLYKETLSDPVAGQHPRPGSSQHPGGPQSPQGSQSSGTPPASRGPGNDAYGGHNLRIHFDV